MKDGKLGTSWDSHPLKYNYKTLLEGIKLQKNNLKEVDHNSPSGIGWSLFLGWVKSCCVINSLPRVEKLGLTTEKALVPMSSKDTKTRKLNEVNFLTNQPTQREILGLQRRVVDQMHSMKKASQYQTFRCGENWVARGMNMYIACMRQQSNIYNATIIYKVIMAPELSNTFKLQSLSHYCTT